MSEIQAFKLGKTMELQYIPFIQLINPWRLSYAWEGECSSVTSIPLCNSRALKTIKNSDIDALILSIRQFGLLNPLTVWKIPEEKTNELSKRYWRGKFEIPKYAIIDGQRRYFAIKRMFRFKDFEEIERDSERGRMPTVIILTTEKMKKKKEKQLEVPVLEEYILIPCVVYNYESLGECMRHSIEDNKFSVRPSQIYLECAERLGKILPDIMPKDFCKIIDLKNKINKIHSELRDKHLEDRERTEKRGDRKLKKTIKRNTANFSEKTNK